MRRDLLRHYADRARAGARHPERRRHRDLPPGARPDPPRSGSDSIRRRPYVLFVGRISRQKGLLHLIRAIPDLTAGTQVVLCAGCRRHDRDRARGRGGRGAESGRSGQGIVWIPEMVDRATAVELYSHAAVFCCPSVYEPFGLINLEAMACEIPVVATRGGRHPRGRRRRRERPPRPRRGGGARRRRRAARPRWLHAGPRPMPSTRSSRTPPSAGRWASRVAQRAEALFSWGVVARRTLALYHALVDGTWALGGPRGKLGLERGNPEARAHRRGARRPRSRGAPRRPWEADGGSASKNRDIADGGPGRPRGRCPGRAGCSPCSTWSSPTEGRERYCIPVAPPGTGAGAARRRHGRACVLPGAARGHPRRRDARRRARRLPVRGDARAGRDPPGAPRGESATHHERAEQHVRSSTTAGSS